MGDLVGTGRMTVGDLVGTRRMTVAGSCERTTELGTVAGSCETGHRQNDGAGLRTVVDGGFWVDGEREGKFGGKLGEEK